MIILVDPTRFLREGRCTHEDMKEHSVLAGTLECRKKENKQLGSKVCLYLIKTPFKSSAMIRLIPQHKSAMLWPFRRVKQHRIKFACPPFCLRPTVVEVKVLTSTVRTCAILSLKCLPERIRPRS